MSGVRGWFGGGVALLGLSCAGPSLPQTGGDSVVSVQLEPAAPLGAVPLVWRAKLRHAAASAEPWLFAGEVSSYHARQLKRGEVASALRERALPLRFWQDGDDRLLQPLVTLKPNATYTLAVPGGGPIEMLQTAVEPSPRVERLFPAAGRPKHQLAAVCPLPAALDERQLLLEPGAIPLVVDRDALAELSPGCALLSAGARLVSDAVAPPEVAGALLDPSPWRPSPEMLSAAVCASGEPWHGACLELDDDRVSITPTSADQLWLLRDPVAKTVVAATGARSLLLRDLQAERGAVLRGSVLDSFGRREDFELALEPRPPRRHLVLNEVLANPLGAEATGEWVELLNDSFRSASLAGVWLEDGGGHVPLPAAELLPGELVLLVAPGFRTSSLDVPVPSEIRVLELSGLGARGLSNSGEALLLGGPEGPLSRFPALAASHAGRSWGRCRVEAADDDPAAFVEQLPSPGALNPCPEP